MVPARYYMRLAEILPRQGIDLRALLRDLGLPEEALQQPDARIAFSDVDRLVSRIASVSGRSDIGFELGMRLSVSTHSVVGFGMLSSPTLEHSLRFVSRYFRLVMPSFRLSYIGGADSGTMLFTPVVAMSRTCLNFHLEAIGIAALRDAEDLVSDRRPPCRLTLSIPEPPHVQRYRDLRDVECRFGADAGPFVRVELFENLRAIPLQLADPNALSVAEARCRALVHDVTGGRRFSEWVVMTAREMGDGIPTLQELSKMLSLSPRTLNRYLEREGTCYRDLAGKVQFELACERLSAGTMSITEIGHSLGFRDSANFARAFRAKAGCTPSEYREKRTSDA